MKQRFFKLLFNKFVLCACFTNIQWLAATKNRSDIILKCNVQFLCKKLVAFTKIFATFGVTKHNKTNVERLQHFNGNFTSICAAFFVVTILRCNKYLLFAGNFLL